MGNTAKNEELVDSFGSIIANQKVNNGLSGKSGDEKPKSKYLEIAFMTCVSGAGLLFGFSSALASAKKKDANSFDKGLSMAKTKAESGGSLAMRALLWGTIYAFSGFGLFCFTVWKAMDVKDLKEFRQKVGNILPRITPTEPSDSRTEFSSLKDLLQYIIEESDKSKQNNKNKPKEE